MIGERERLKQLERESRTQEGQRNLMIGLRIFSKGGSLPPTEMMVAFIDEHRQDVGSRANMHCSADRSLDLLRGKGYSQRP
jgi:hypothetical protein